MNENIEIIEKGTGGPVIFWLMHSFGENDAAAHLCKCLNELVPDASYGIAVCEVEDWNRELSPWAADAASEEEGNFAGDGPRTLQRLTELIVPSVMKQLGEGRKKILAGYSLAGLFSLWAAYETDLFDGIICCSGSLWFDGWKQYAESHCIKRDSSIYLSLGGKESNTPNVIMAGIGAATKAQERLLKADPNVRNLTYEMNPGGHFADSGKRLGKGIKWMLERHSATAMVKEAKALNRIREG